MMRFEAAAIFVYRDPVDFRKSINGLCALVAEQESLDIFSQSLFVFGCRARNKIKILYWDKTGFCLWQKRLEKDKFKWPKRSDAVLNLSAEQLDWLLRGLDISKLIPHQEKYFDLVF